MYLLVSNLGIDSTHASRDCAIATKYKRTYWSAFHVTEATEVLAPVVRPCVKCVRVNEDEGERPLQAVDCE